MTCSRPSCACLVDADNAFKVDGDVYCCETCAKECTDETCVCTSCDCKKKS